MTKELGLTSDFTLSYLDGGVKRCSIHFFEACFDIQQVHLTP